MGIIFRVMDHVSGTHIRSSVASNNGHGLELSSDSEFSLKFFHYTFRKNHNNKSL